MSVIPSNHLILCCPLLLLSSNHQGLFQWVSSSHQVAKVLEFQLQHQSFQWIFRIDFRLGLTSLISLQSKGLSRVSSSTTIQKHQFFITQPFLWLNSHLYMTIGKTIALMIQTFVGKVLFLLFNIVSRFVIALWLHANKCLMFKILYMKQVSQRDFSYFIVVWP